MFKHALDSSLSGENFRSMRIVYAFSFEEEELLSLLRDVLFESVDC